MRLLKNIPYWANVNNVWIEIAKVDVYILLQNTDYVIGKTTNKEYVFCYTDVDTEHGAIVYKCTHLNLSNELLNELDKTGEVIRAIRKDKLNDLL